MNYKIKQHFGNKTFLKHQIKAFEQFLLITFSRNEDESFLTTATPISKQIFSIDPSVIANPKIYKIKTNDDEYPKVKAWTAPRGKEDDLEKVLSKESSTSTHTGVHSLELMTSLYGWKLIIQALSPTSPTP